MFPLQDTKPSNELISKFFAFFLTASIVLAVEKLLLHIFSSQFHMRAYAERMEKIQKSANVLEKLSRGVRSKRILPSFFSGSKSNSPSNSAKNSPNNSSVDLASQGRKGSTLEVEAQGNQERKASAFTIEVAKRAKEVGTGLVDVSKALAGIDIHSSSSIKRYLAYN
jgi:hypothetical protein